LGLETHWGGKGASQAVAAARRGARVEFCTAVEGRHLAEVRAVLKGCGVGVRHTRETATQ
jgi:sugar/nucleoside kinase (ribokinase family)